MIKNHGPLLNYYYSYGDGQKQEGDDEHTHGDPTKIKGAQWGDFGQYDFISEGDSPAYLHLIDVGLDNLDHPEWGGWGGRLVQSQEQPNRWEDGEAAADYNPFTKKIDLAYPQVRWVEAIQQDFAGRADWCIVGYDGANHPPKIRALTPLRIMANAGETVALEIQATDPDGDALEINYWIYQEVGSYSGNAEISFRDQRASLLVPAGHTGSLHIIAEVKDKAVHPMTRYQRFVIEVQ